jgi:hypothetical protein
MNPKLDFRAVVYSLSLNQNMSVVQFERLMELKQFHASHVGVFLAAMSGSEKSTVSVR